jgi:YfiH family protein
VTLAGAGLILPDWPAPARVRACFTTRAGGASAAPYAASPDAPGLGGLNLGLHTGDSAAAVSRNRAWLAATTGCRIAWLDQVHGTTIVDAHAALDADPAHKADGCVTDRVRLACAIMVADCLPVLLCDTSGTAVAAAHAGWRGLAAGVLEAAADALRARCAKGASLMAWIGPAIGPGAFEVGEDVRAAFAARTTPAERDATRRAFSSRAGGEKFNCDLAALARLRLARAGVGHIGASGRCTVTEAASFYSYRRDGRTGRMAALVWLADD